MNRPSTTGWFVDSVKGRIFLTHRKPVGASRGCVLLVPPFAEEMNKSRRMLAVAARRLAERGISTVLPDLYGTGDSEGNFSGGDWSTWQHDVLCATQWASVRGLEVSGILAVRVGCELAMQALADSSLSKVETVVFWQPVLNAAQYVNQFLRLRTAAALMEDRKETVQDLRSQLLAGATVEIAGYPLSGQLFRDLDSLAARTSVSSFKGTIHWMEMNRAAGTALSPTSARIVESSRLAGARVETAVFAGERFWNSSEVLCNDAMVEATVAALS